MKEELHIETWEMADLLAQTSILPELFGEECNVIRVKRNEESVLAILPWNTFLELLKEVTLNKQKE